MPTSSPDPEATARLPADAPPTPRSRTRESQFAPGTMIGARYQIGGLLGSGGMGEVYRADDVKLDQPVALKFLPSRLARDPVLLARLHDEVRLGRQVSHPNVCRIYDIGEWNGAHFVAMEFVDGEDLGRLLRRIGRVPHDKAVEITRGIAAGMTAAHAKGILHRDLKPANVMIDSHGEAKIMDFGLALGAGDDDGAIAGTPAYMAPEQLDGQPATVQSDLYALGLVMYELFTGKRAHGGRSVAERVRDTASDISTPSSILREIDADVERVLLRCMAKDPSERPRSARDVIASLPGGDPLAAALAAGETPSPRVVAAAGAEGSLRVTAAWTLLAVTLLMIFAIGVWLHRDSLLQRYPLDQPPEVLADRATAILREAGIPPQPYWSGRLELNDTYLAWIAGTDQTANRWSQLRSGPPIITFTMRRTATPETPVTRSPLARTASGTEVVLGAEGKLMSLTAVPAVEWRPRPLNWAPLFAAAGLHDAQLTAVEPQFVPPFAADSRHAWTGRYAGSSTPIRVEAAAWRGRPVLFRVTGAWDDAGRSLIDKQPFARPALLAFVTVVMLCVICGSAILAWRNLRMRRGDREGAFRLAAAILALELIQGLGAADHQLEARHQLSLLQHSAAAALLWSAFGYVLYIALEPFVRRRWPAMLIGWTRLLGGSVRDPMVGRDLLVGCAAGVAHAAISTFSWPVIASLANRPPPLSVTGEMTALAGARFGIALVAGAVTSAITIAFAVTVLLVFATILFRRRSLSIAAVAAVLLTAYGFATGDVWMMPVAAALVALLLGTIVRFGLLAFIAAQAAFALIFHYPLPIALTWWTGLALIGPGVVVAATLWGFRQSLGSQSPFGARLLDA